MPYAIQQAKRYLADPILGCSLRDNLRLMIGHEGKTASEILGTADGLKSLSSKTDAQTSIHDPRISKTQPGSPNCVWALSLHKK